jgi:hypothetical protein
MNRSTIRSFLFAAATAVVALAPTTSAGAQSVAGPELSAEQVRAQYLEHGFAAGAPITWWTNGSTSFTVQDPTEQNTPSARVLMVIVYPDTATAEAERSSHGEHLVPGYGPSVWQGNVALMQTTRDELARRYAAEVNRDDPSFVGTGAEPEVTADPSYLVGLDFLAVLQGATVNL